MKVKQMDEIKKLHRLYGSSHQGMLRANNEDSFLVDTDRNYMVVADGMGGAAAGEVASSLTVEAVMNVLAAASGDKLSTDVLRSAVYKANERVYGEASDGHKAGMGCTLVVFAVSGSRFYACHVGDSRLYLYRGGKIYKITNDHSYVGELVEKGVLTEEEAAVHPDKNIITRCVGTKPSVEADIISNNLREGDIFLACSDGLTNELSDEEISVILASTSEETVVSALIDKANANGGRDNVTATLFYCGTVDVEDTLDVPIIKPSTAVSGGMIVSANEQSKYERVIDSVNYYSEISWQIFCEHKMTFIIIAGSLMIGIIIGALLVLAERNNGSTPGNKVSNSNNVTVASTTEIAHKFSSAQNSNADPFSQAITNESGIQKNNQPGVSLKQSAPAAQNTKEQSPSGERQSLTISPNVITVEAGREISLDQHNVTAKILRKDIFQQIITEEVDINKLVIAPSEDCYHIIGAGRIQIRDDIKTGSIKMRLTYRSEKSNAEFATAEVTINVKPVIISIEPSTTEVSLIPKTEKFDLSRHSLSIKFSNGAFQSINLSDAVFQCNNGTIEVIAGKKYYKNIKNIFPEKLICAYKNHTAEITINKKALIKNQNGNKKTEVLPKKSETKLEDDDSVIRSDGI